MKDWAMKLMVLAGSLWLAQGAWAQAPAVVPAGATGICRDGTYTREAKKDGACRGHKGVQTWYAVASMPAPTPEAGRAPAAMPAPTPMKPGEKPAVSPTGAPPATMPTPVPASGKGRSGPAAAAVKKTAAPGGGPGLVWLNTASNVYHCNGSDFYGKTKQGAYMTETDAKAKGAHGVRGATCAGK